jgi:hypothetical protein
VGEPGAAQYTISRWPVSGMCSTPEQSAEVSVYLATLPADGPSGVLWGYLWTTDGTDSCGVLPW